MASQSKSVGEVIAELRELVVAYAKQETVDPLKALGDVLKYGLVGAVLTAFGTALLALGVLRLLQTELDDTFDGNWSFVPYLVTLALASAVIAYAIHRIVSPTSERGEQP